MLFRKAVPKETEEKNIGVIDDETWASKKRITAVLAEEKS